MGLRVRISLRVWMSVSCVCCMLCTASATSWSLIKRSPIICVCVCIYLIACGLKTSTMEPPKFELGCCAIRRELPAQLLKKSSTLQNSKKYCHVHKIPALDSTISGMTLFNTFLPYFIKIVCIFFHLVLGLPNGLLPWYMTQEKQWSKTEVWIDRWLPKIPVQVLTNRRTDKSLPFPGIELRLFGSSVLSLVSIPVELCAVYCSLLALAGRHTFGYKTGWWLHIWQGGGKEPSGIVCTRGVLQEVEPCIAGCG